MNELNKFEQNLLNIAQETLRERVDLLNNIGGNEDIYKVGTGIEGYLQTVLLNAYMINGLHASTTGKKAKDCDIIIEDVGIELKSELIIGAKTFYKNMLKEHPRADLYIFLSRSNIKDDILNFFNEKGYIKDYRDIDPNWIIWLVKKSNMI